MNPKMDHEAALKEATVLFKAADVDNNGSISFSEWCAAGINMQKQSKLNMKQAFGAAVSKKIQTLERELRRTFNALDANGDRQIEEKEFVTAFI